MAFRFPQIYPILDSSFIPSPHRAESLRNLASSLRDAGVTLLEYRNKTGPDTQLLADAAILRTALPAPHIKLILDDRVDLVDHTQFDGAHVDAGDLAPTDARRLLGPSRILGAYGGTEALLPGILSAPADYLSIGPIFATTTKQTAKPPIGLDGIRKLRAEAGPEPLLVAVGGVTRSTARSVIEAGATLIAVAAGIFHAPDPAAEFRAWLRELT